MPKVRERAGGSAGDKTPGPELVDCWLVPCLVLRTRSKTLAGLCGLIVRATGGRALHPSSFAPPKTPFMSCTSPHLSFYPGTLQQHRKDDSALDGKVEC